MEVPIDDIVKVGSGSAGGMGLMALLFRFLKNDMRQAETTQGEINRKMWKKYDDISAALVEHRIEAAKTFVSRDEFSAFRTHMDDQFEKTRNLVFELLRGNQK
jgi:uncharacterized membrane-anchored protein YhcB (DUF1043 family)